MLGEGTSATDTSVECTTDSAQLEGNAVQVAEIPTYPDVLPIIEEEGGRVVRVIFPRYMTPPKPEVLQEHISLIQDASYFGILTRINRTAVICMIRFYGTSDKQVKIAEDLGMFKQAVSESIRRGMRRAHRLLNRVAPDLVAFRYPDIEVLMEFSKTETIKHNFQSYIDKLNDKQYRLDHGRKSAEGKARRRARGNEII